MANIIHKVGALGTFGTPPRDFTALQSWEDAMPVDLTVENNTYIAECYNDAALAPVNVAGHTTSATAGIVIRPAAGQGFKDHPTASTNRLAYNQAWGVAIYCTGGVTGVGGIGQSYVTLDGLQIRNDVSEGLTWELYQNCVVKNCIAYAVGSGSNINRVSARLDGNGLMLNCLMVLQDSAAHTMLWYAGSNTYVNCLFVKPSNKTGNGARGHVNTYGTGVVRNTGYFNWAANYAGTFDNTVNAGNNSADAGSLMGGTGNTGAQTYVNQFVNPSMAVADTEDFRLKAGSGLIGRGRVDSNAATDIYGVTRSTYDIGPAAYATTGGGGGGGTPYSGEVKIPDAILAQSGSTGTIATLQDDPAGTDTTYLTIGTAASSVRCSFPTPQAPLSGIQTFGVRWRKNATVGSACTATIAVLENGVQKAVSGTITIADGAGQYDTFTWDASVLTDKSGATVEILCLQTGGATGTTGNRRFMALGSVRWTAAGLIPLAAALGASMSAKATMTGELIVTPTSGLIRLPAEALISKPQFGAALNLGNPDTVGITGYWPFAGHAYSLAPGKRKAPTFSGPIVYGAGEGGRYAKWNGANPAGITTGSTATDLGIAGAASRTILAEFDFDPTLVPTATNATIYSVGTGIPQQDFTLATQQDIYWSFRLNLWGPDYTISPPGVGDGLHRVALAITYDTDSQTVNWYFVIRNYATGVVTRYTTSRVPGVLNTSSATPMTFLQAGVQSGYLTLPFALHRVIVWGGRALDASTINRVMNNPNALLLGPARYGIVQLVSVAAPLPKVSTITDSFDGTGVDGAKWFSGADAGETITVGGGKLSFTTAVGVTAYAGLYSAARGDFTGSAAFVKIACSDSSVVSASGSLRLTHRDAGDVGVATTILQVAGVQIIAAKDIGGTFTALSYIPYVPANHAWVRLRESGGTTYWEAAPATASNPPLEAQWSVLYSQANVTADITRSNIELSCGTWQVETKAAVYSFDGLNIGADAVTNSYKAFGGFLGYQ